MIRKRISLEFLGDDYKDSFLVFKAVPMDDYEAVVADAQKAQNAKQSYDHIKRLVTSRFIEGEIYDFDTKKSVAVTTENMGKLLDQDCFLRAYQELTGVVSPKA